MFFLLFFISGACGLTYQIVWLRVAAANFGVTTISISILLSIFMAGLSIGSWAAGRFARRFATKGPRFFTLSYAACEAVIGLSGLVVAPLLRAGGSLVTQSGGEWASAGFYAVAGGWIALVVLPFACAMGATLPLALAALGRPEKESGFARLYLANVLGALAGTFACAFALIEALGFAGTLGVAAALNFAVALIACSFAFSFRAVAPKLASPAPAGAAASFAGPELSAPERAAALGLLFFSGLSSLGMEVVWTRQFAPLIGALVYSFAVLLIAYLWGTAWGASRYRELAGRLGLEPRAATAIAATAAGAAAMLPALAADPQLVPVLPHAYYSIPPYGVMLVLITVGLFSAVAGFLTPLQIDLWSKDQPSRAGAAYAVNALGCIVGPLLASFVLLPRFGERAALALFAAPYFLFGLYFLLSRRRAALTRAWGAGLAVATTGAAAIAAFAVDYSNLYPASQVRRDFTATTVAVGEGMTRKLLVNGIGMTNLTPITKSMIHLPAAMMETAPKKILVLCFGMGTSFRSGLTWDAETTVVELVPGVPKLFDYFHADAKAVRDDPKAHIVIDDARRFLRRTQDRYDLIVIDPPPPASAAASSLLYSKEFYALARLRLSERGVVAQWLPRADEATAASVARAIGESFPHVRAFDSVENWGTHYLASETPLAAAGADELAARMPVRAQQDFVEWGPQTSAKAQFEALVQRERPLASLIALAPNAPALSDDRPVNEYFLLRHLQSSLAPAADSRIGWLKRD